MSNSIHKNPSLIYHQDIKDICKLLKKLNITYFAHAKNSANNEFSAISSNPEFFEFYLKNRFYNADIHVAKQLAQSKYVMWDSFELDGETAKLEEQSVALGILHTFTIVKPKKDGGGDYFHFASDVKSMQMNQIYLTNIDILELFIRYFTEQVSQSSRLSSAYDHKYTIDKEKSEYSFIDSGSEITNTELRASLIHQLSGCNLTSLSKREKECLNYIIRGNTTSNIAKILNLSARTIESHLLSIKNKLGVESKKELIEKLIDLR